MDLLGGNHEVNMWLPHAAHQYIYVAQSTQASVSMATSYSGSPFNFFLKETQRSSTSTQREKETAATMSGYQWSM